MVRRKPRSASVWLSVVLALIAIGLISSAFDHDEPLPTGSTRSTLASSGPHPSAPLSPSTVSTPPPSTPRASTPQDQTTMPMPASSNPQDWTPPIPVVRVVDGDTIKVLDNHDELTIRIIGMDTPETKDPRKPVQCYGPQASQRAEQLLAGTHVRLEFDPSQGRLDRYGRTLAYVHLADGRLYESIMIAEGYAHEYTYHSVYRYQASFRLAQQTARTNRVGFWSPTTCNGDTAKPAS